MEPRHIPDVITCNSCRLLLVIAILTPWVLAIGGIVWLSR